MTKTCIVMLAACLVCPPAFAQHETHGTGALSAEQVGTVDFQTSCAPARQDRLQPGRGAAALVLVPGGDEGLRGDRAEGSRLRDGALGRGAEPVGQSVRRPPHAADDRDRRSGHREGPRHRHADAARARATSMRSPACSPAPTPTRSARASSRTRRRWGQIAARNPGDTEARIFYALAVNQTAVADRQDLRASSCRRPPSSSRSSRRCRIIPGSRTTSFTPTTRRRWRRRALVAARRYASIAPAVPHALHMPSHTFTRVGSWKESIDTNRRSAEAARKGGRPAPARSCTRSTTRSTRTCRLAQDAAAQGRARPRVTIVGGSTASAPARRGRRVRRSPPFRRATRSSAAPGARRRR